MSRSFLFEETKDLKNALGEFFYKFMLQGIEGKRGCVFLDEGQYWSILLRVDMRDIMIGEKKASLLIKLGDSELNMVCKMLDELVNIV